jgi:hypothetical protein
VVAALFAFFAFAASASAAFHPFITSWGSFSNPQSVAVDSAGSVYVLDIITADVKKYDPQGNPVEFTSLGSNILTGAATPAGTFSYGEIFEAPVGQIAVDNSAGAAAGSLYVTDRLHNVVDVFSATSGEYLGQITQTEGSELVSPCGVAAGTGGKLYIADLVHGMSRYGPTAKPAVNADYESTIGAFGVCQLGVDPSGTVYGNSSNEGPLRKYPASQFGSYGEGTVVENVSRGVAVDPASGDVYVAETGGIDQFDSSGTALGRFGTNRVKDARGLAVDPNNGDVFAGNFGSGKVTVFGPTLPPVRPQVLVESASPGQTEALLESIVNPGNDAATYYFEYGQTAGYGSATATGAVSIDGEGVSANRNVVGLSPGTEYHFRVVVTNSVDTVPGPDQTFTTSVPPEPVSCPNEALRVGASAALPECRAYEMVSPPDKSGGGVSLITTPQGAASGSAIAFASTASFADAPAHVVGNLYVARRGSSDWSTAGVDAPQLNPRGLLPNVSTANSPDLEKTLQLSKRALTPGAIEGGSNIYVQDNATGARSLIAASPGYSLMQEGTTVGAKPYVGGSTDWSHIVLRSSVALAADALEGAGNLYDYSEGQLKLVNYLPNDSVSSLGSLAGYPHSLANSRAVSTDGSRIFFMTAVNFDNGPLYLRENGTTTIPISVSHRAGADETVYPALFVSATADGSRVFFTSPTNLTEESETLGSETLYRYDVETGVLTDLTVTQSPDRPDVRHVLAISDDGSYVYFAAGGVLAEGATEPGLNNVNLYAWHEGTIKYIGQTTDGAEFPGPGAALASPNGKHFAFSSFSHLTQADVPSPKCPHDNGLGNPAESCEDVYVFEYPTGELTCVSCDGPGAGFSNLGGIATIDAIKPSFGTYYPRAVLDDGTVFFNTPNKLVPKDSNGVGDAYAWKDGKATLVSTGADEGVSSFADSTPDGSDIFFRTAQPLVAQDVDQSTDLYDSKVGGGFAAQNAATKQPCDGESCRSAPPAPPATSTPASASSQGRGNASGHRSGPCSRLAKRAERADSRARKLERQAGKASGRTARRLREQASQGRKKAKRLRTKAHDCGGQR